MFSEDELNKIHSKESRFLLSRLDSTEKHLGDLCNNFGGFANRKAKLRDSGDEVSNSLHKYGESESVNKSLSDALKGLAELLAQVQDYRNEEVSRLENHVICPLSSYEKICAGTRDDLRQSLDLRRKELRNKKSVDKAAAASYSSPSSSTPHRRLQLSEGELKREKWRESALESCSQLDRKLDAFEETKIKDLKNVLTQFVKTELAFHAKSVEIFTKAYNEVVKINEEEDLEDFQAARELYERVLRNALKGDTGSRSDLLPEEKEGRISPVIFGGSERKKKAGGKSKDLSKSIEDLKTREYEEIAETNLSSSDSDY